MSRDNARREAPAVARNRAAILAVLERVLPTRGLVLEIASGTGEHAAHFARALPALEFAPSDPQAESRESIDAWRDHEGLHNLRRAIDIDVHDDDWKIEEPLDAMFCCNMIHIAPWTAALALLRGAARRLLPDAPLVLYGPYKRSGTHTSESNAAFDASLRSRNSHWGVRDLDAVVEEAEAVGLKLDEIVEMPANNLSVVFRRAGDP